MAVSAATLAEIKDRLNLADLIGDYGIDIKHIGSSYKACCPFHNEKTPSFHINVEKGFYKCFGCGEHGDAIAFVQKYEGIPFAEALQKLAERVGVTLEERYDPQARIRARLYQINQELAAFYRRCLLQTREGQIARDYLASRQLSDETAEQFGIGYAPEGPDTLIKWAEKHGFALDELVAAGLLAPPRRPGDRYYDRFHGRLTFPICDTQGRVVAFSCRLLREAKHTGKYVNSPETAIFKKSNTLYALHLARVNIAKATPRRAIVCEGQIDVIRCHSCGFNVAVASQGTAFTEEHVALLKRYADAVDLVFDSDAAGVKAALRTMELFLTAGIPVRIVTLPQGEDPDSLLRKSGLEAFQQCLNAAEDPAPFLVRSLKAQEQAPEAMEATIRIARTAVTTVANCPTPVLTTRFLQDVAQLLNLPFDTLNRDLETVREDAAEIARRRAEFQAQQAPVAIAPKDTSPTPPPAAEETLSSDFTEADFDAAEYVDDWALLPENQDETTVEAVNLNVSQNLTEALCELLVHHFTDSDVMGCLLQHLPPTFVRHPFAAKLYDLAVAATLSKRQILEPDRSDAAFNTFLAQHFVMPDRCNSGNEEMTPLSYAQDLVRRFWLCEFEYREKLLDPTSTEAFQLTLDRKRLQSLAWDAAAPFMNALDPKFAAPAPEPQAVSTPIVQASPVPEDAGHTAEPDTLPPEAEVTAEPMEWLSEDDEVNIYDTL
ncbi:MAG: DNA primase [Kiritimatiellae bacterium]|nr:DNA primase [Kiritimatiellia bacterium]